ncbi:hypothetical protein GOBAR_DD07699 [Gossypium barbadense]|nr:hypothetical protein GOBAR_DD07699 [Gossypium barbadense]
MGPKQWVSLSNMLPILPPTLRRPTGRPTRVRRKEPNEPQTTEWLSKRGVDMRCNKCKRIGHNKKSCKGEVGQNILQQATPNQQESTLTQQATPTQLQTAPTHQQAAPTHQKDTAPREKLSFKRKPTIVKWMPPTQESSMTDQ